MEKDFKNWHTIKSQINESTRLPTFKEREIWWCSIGINVGHETDGKNQYFNRPVIVVRKFNRHIFWAVPLTTQIKDNPFYFPIHFTGCNAHKREQRAMLSHLRLYDSKRLHDKMGRLPHDQFDALLEALSGLILKKPLS
jgi:mRNA interferase MazF